MFRTGSSVDEVAEELNVHVMIAQEWYNAMPASQVDIVAVKANQIEQIVDNAHILGPEEAETRIRMRAVELVDRIPEVMDSNNPELANKLGTVAKAINNLANAITPKVTNNTYNTQNNTLVASDSALDKFKLTKRS